MRTQTEMFQTKRIRQTSVETYHEIKNNGLLSELRLLVYETLFHHGPMTQMELCQFLRSDAYSYDRQSLTPRFAELLDRGVIEFIGKRTCRVTGRDVLDWDVTSSLPKEKRYPKKSKKGAVAEEIIREVYNKVSHAFLGNELSNKIETYLNG